METIRVFVSSTFRDMQAERDQLMGKVFPRLRAECLRRGADFVPIDLRWGITQKETDRGLSVSICLTEIDRCRPFFISLLGDRYGWIPTPEEIPVPIFRRVRLPEDSNLLNQWYELDLTSVSPLYRLRKGRQPAEDVRKKLIAILEDAELAGAGDSVTAMEIIHAAFHKDHRKMHAFCYLRNLSRGGFQKPFKRDFFEDDDRRIARLARVKAKVIRARRQGRITARPYPGAYAGLRVDLNVMPRAQRKTLRAIQDDGLIDAKELRQLDPPTQEKVKSAATVVLSGMEHFGELVFKDLLKTIDLYLPPERVGVDPHLRQRAYHDGFLEERTRLFFGRKRYLDRILAYTRDPTISEPLVVTGDPGCGKSALMAEATRMIRAALPNAVVIPYFIGAAPGSSDLRQTIDYLCRALARACALKDDLALDAESLNAQLPTFLARSAARKKTVLLIDALNQLDPAARSHELHWLPYQLPPNAHVVVSSLPGEIVNVLRNRGRPECMVKVRGLPSKDGRTLVEQRLARRGKKLTAAQRRELMNTGKRPDAGLPLYLAVALEELSLFGDFDRLNERIDRLPRSLADLFGQVLDRLERDYPQVATAVLKWLAVARAGLLESEIISLIEQFVGERRTLHWIQFYSALEPYLRPRGKAESLGRIDFYHDQLRHASYREYLKMKTPDSRPGPEFRRTHRQLADFFYSQVFDPEKSEKWRVDQHRALEELPYHLAKGGRTSDLRRVLFDFDWLMAKLSATDAESVIADFDLVPRDRELQRVQAAIRLAGPVLTGDKSQLASQLLGRLLPGKGERLPALLKQAKRWKGATWLRPLDSSLNSPGQTTLRPLVGVSSVGVSPNLRRAFSGSADGTIKVWDVRNRRSMRPLGDASSSSKNVVITPDGRVAISVDNNHALNIWRSFKSSRPAHILPGHTSKVTAIAMTADGRRAVSAAQDQTIRLWDLTRPHQASEFLGHALLINAVAITPDGKRVISASGEGELKSWGADGVANGRTFGRHNGLVRALAVTPDGRRALAASDSTITLWDVERGTKLRKLSGHKNLVRTIVVTPDGKRAISGSDDIRIRIWDLERDAESIEFEAHWWAITALSITADGSHLVSCSDDEMLKVWEFKALCEQTASEPLRLWTGANQWINAVAMMPNGTSVISASRDQTLKIWDLKSRKVIKTLKGHRGWANAVAVTPNGRRIVSGSDDNRLGVWDLNQTIRVRFLEGHTNGISAVAVTPDGKRAVSGCWDQTIKIWNLETWEVEKSLRGHKRPKGEAWIRALVLTPDAKKFVTASHDHTLRLWDLDSGKEIRRFLGHRNWVMSVAVFPDGRRMISGSADGTLRIWELATGKELQRLEGHSNYVTCVALLPGSRQVVSTSEDQTLRLWDIQSGKCLATFTADGQLRTCTVTPDGSLIIAGEDSGRMHFLHPEFA